MSGCVQHRSCSGKNVQVYKCLSKQEKMKKKRETDKMNRKGM